MILVSSEMHSVLGRGRIKKRRLLGRTRHRWENNIKIDLKEIN